MNKTFSRVTTGMAGAIGSKLSPNVTEDDPMVQHQEFMAGLQKTFPHAKNWGWLGAMWDYNRHYKEGIEERISLWDEEAGLKEYWGEGMFYAMEAKKYLQGKAKSMGVKMKPMARARRQSGKRSSSQVKGV